MPPAILVQKSSYFLLPPQNSDSKSFEDKNNIFLQIPRKSIDRLLSLWSHVPDYINKFCNFHTNILLVSTNFTGGKIGANSQAFIIIIQPRK
jgi:hypothetical protein